MNNIVVSGNLTHDPEIKTTGSGKNKTEFITFTIADNLAKDEAQFFNCCCFGNLMDFVDKHFKKGSHITVSGKLIMSKYETKDKEVRFNLNINNINGVGF